jgi:hypothetical protein
MNLGFSGQRDGLLATKAEDLVVTKGSLTSPKDLLVPVTERVPNNAGASGLRPAMGAATLKSGTNLAPTTVELISQFTDCVLHVK